MDKQVAIVGTAAPTSAMANQEPLNVEIWGCGGTFRTLHRVDRWYEMHTRADIQRAYKEHYDEYMTFLKKLEVPCMMQEEHDDIPASQAYPLSLYLETYGTVLSSSIAYMLADAISECYDTIKLFGVNMKHESEYGSQHAGLAFLIGWAKAKGINVVIPDESPLLKYISYGILETEDADFVMREQTLDRQIEQLTKAIGVLGGQKVELAHWRKWFGDRVQGQVAEKSKARFNGSLVTVEAVT